METLKRCPFIGCLECRIERESLRSGRIKYWVQCVDCLARGPMMYEESAAVREWNSRVYDSHWPVVVQRETVKLSEVAEASERPPQRRKKPKAKGVADPLCEAGGEIETEASYESTGETLSCLDDDDL